MEQYLFFDCVSQLTLIIPLNLIIPVHIIRYINFTSQFNPTQPHDDHIKCKYHSSVFVPKIDYVALFELYFDV